MTDRYIVSPASQRALARQRNVSNVSNQPLPLLAQKPIDKFLRLPRGFSSGNHIYINSVRIFSIANIFDGRLDAIHRQQAQIRAMVKLRSIIAEGIPQSIGAVLVICHITQQSDHIVNGFCFQRLAKFILAHHRSQHNRLATRSLWPLIGVNTRIVAADFQPVVHTPGIDIANLFFTQLSQRIILMRDKNKSLAGNGIEV